MFIMGIQELNYTETVFAAVVKNDELLKESSNII